MGFVHLGRDSRRLHDLRLASANVDPFCRRLGDERGVFFERLMDVGGLSDHHGRGVVVVERRVLTCALPRLRLPGRDEEQRRHR